MVLRAVTAGPAAWGHLTSPMDDSGEVLAVYERSLLWLAGPDQPLTLAWDPALRGPLTLEVDGPVRQVLPGDPVVRVGSGLCIGTEAVVDLSRVVPFDEPLPLLGADGAAALKAALGRSLRDPAVQTLFGALVRPAPADAWTQTVLPRVNQLMAGLEICSEPMVTAATAQLVGLGQGLTPSGDDFLAGMLAAFQAAAPTGSPCTALLAEAVSRHLGQTTLMSRHFLRWAIRRRYGESVRRVFVSPGAIAGLLAAGATSGADTATGIWAGLGLVRRMKAAVARDAADHDHQRKPD